MSVIMKTVDLKKHFPVGKKNLLHAVDGVHLEIKKGKTLGVVGESGCGKSTLGRLITRLLPATSGEIYFQGKEILSLEGQALKDYRKQVQIIFQDPFSSLDPRMSVFELIAEPILRHRICARRKEVLERVGELMETVGLAERFLNAYPHEMDGGRRQRVGVARALALKPEFIVCDEPVSALDVSIQAQILNLLMDMQEEMGLSYLFITHDLSVVRHISDEIMVMYLGQCIERAASAELFQNPMHPYTRALLEAIPKPVLDAKRERKLLRGEVSDPINPPPGCRFHNRCEQGSPRCLAGEVPLIDIGRGHQVACTLYQNQ